ncbi:hypothetical protein [Streptomyces meridianus]|uniref:Uncharacterized protein n=1 Tax=Streptomyces meridianus TaxID=2938945 RepID=A0ABT0XB11_9ACTN|nr:hypothetical protein [Streptomyces meridianus]MCM2579703.1 hypothetical protein [Streptomyces meridianus]
MPHRTSTEIAGRIEDLYGAPLADLHAHARAQPPGMLSTLLGMHHDLASAERSIDIHRDHLAQLVHPGRQIGGHEVSHVLDCARRLAEAAAVRDVQTKTASAVLRSLGRLSSLERSRAPSAVPAALTPAVPAASAARSR